MRCDFIFGRVPAAARNIMARDNISSPRAIAKHANSHFRQPRESGCFHNCTHSIWVSLLPIWQHCPSEFRAQAYGMYWMTHSLREQHMYSRLLNSDATAPQSGARALSCINFVILLSVILCVHVKLNWRHRRSRERSIRAFEWATIELRSCERWVRECSLTKCVQTKKPRHLINPAKKANSIVSNVWTFETIKFAVRISRQQQKHLRGCWFLRVLCER